jgi:hypothetical protein
MTPISAKVVGRATAAVLLGALTLNMPASRAQVSNSVSGDAFGAFVQTATASLARSPLATLDPTGMGDAVAAAVNVAGVLAAESLNSVTTGVVGENAASAQSGSTLQNVNILAGLITAADPARERADHIGADREHDPRAPERCPDRCADRGHHRRRRRERRCLRQVTDLFWRSGRDHPLADRVADETGDVVDVELGHRPRAMLVDGLGTEMED